MNKLRRILIGSAISVAAASFASASPIIGCADTAAFLPTSDSTSCYDATVLSTPINFGPNPLSIPLFDPAFGTLNYVEIIAWASGSVTESVSNNSTTTAESFTNGTASIQLQFSGTGFTTITMNPGATNLSGGPIAPGNVFTSDVQTIHADTTAGFGQFVSIPGFLAPFKGAFNCAATSSCGTVGSLSASGGPSGAGGNGGPDLFYNANGSVGGTISILYDYTPPPSGVPEPATMALMGGALIGLGMLGKRFKKS